MLVQVVNSRGHVIMQVTDIRDMFDAEQIRNIVNCGYEFKVGGEFVSPMDVQQAAMRSALNGR